MADSPSLKYHTQAFHLLGKRPRTTDHIVNWMKQREEKLGFRFPEAVREWFAYGGKNEIGRLLERYNEGLREIPWPRLGARVGVGSGRKREYDAVSEGLLLLVVGEKEGCWAVRLAGDDPPVLWADCIDIAFAKAPEDIEWKTLSETFSAFVLSCVWRYWKADRARGGSGPVVAACMPPVRPRDLAYLLMHYEEGPQVRDHLYDHLYLFRQSGFYLAIVDEEGDVTSAWFGGADRPSRLLRELQRLRHASHFFHEEYTTECQGPAMEIWQEVRDNPPPYPGAGWEALFGVDLVPLSARGELIDSDLEPALPPPHIDYLIDHFDEKARQSLAHGLTAYHFAAPDGRLLIVSAEHGKQAARSSWWLHADDGEAMRRLLRSVWQIGTLAEKARGRTDAARALLAELRGEPAGGARGGQRRRKTKGNS